MDTCTTSLVAPVMPAASASSATRSRQNKPAARPACTRRAFLSAATCAGLLAALGAGTPGAASAADASDPAVDAAFAQLTGAFDLDFSLQIQQTIASFGDNPDVGMRSAGSPAEADVADYLLGVMADLGLSNVTADPFACDTWTFEKARLYLPGGDGAFIALGGYATTLVCDNEELGLVYGGRGTEADLADLDVAGKLVLIQINQYDDWWINHPAYQAHLYGAKAVIAYNDDGYAQYDETTIGSQDICGPDYAPALAICKRDFETLRALIDAAGGEATVTLDCSSKVALDGTSRNVWGEIPGASDEVIYLGAHMDGYYHSFYDDAFGCAIALGLAKAVLDSGYIPAKTLRFVFVGAEEWGSSNCESDWARGSYEQLNTVHPEWAADAFALLNIDDMFCPLGETTYWLACAYELLPFTVRALAPVVQEFPQYTITIDAPCDTGTDQFNYAQAGVACIDAAMGEPDECFYKRNLYHSNKDSMEPAFDFEAYAMVNRVFARLLVALDAQVVRPMAFAEEFSALDESLDRALIGDDAPVLAALERAQAAAAVLDEKTAGWGASAGDAAEKTAGAADLADPANPVAYNRGLHEVYRAVRAALVTWMWDGSLAFPTGQAQANIGELEAALEALRAGDGDAAYDEHLWCVDYNWYAYDFSRDCFDFQVARVRDNAAGTWGEGLIVRPNQDLYDVIAYLGEHYGEQGVDYAEPIAALEDALATQRGYLAELVEKLAADLDALTALMEGVAAQA